MPCMGGVDGGAFGSGAGGGVFVADVGQVEAAAGRVLDEALGCGLFFGALHVFGDAGVEGDEGFGGQAAYTQRLGEAVLAHAVNQAAKLMVLVELDCEGRKFGNRNGLQGANRRRALGAAKTCNAAGSPKPCFSHSRADFEQVPRGPPAP